MDLLQICLLLLVAGVCGAVGQAIGGFTRGGCLVSIGLGFVGALLGMYIARLLKLPELFAVPIGTTKFPVAWAVLGAALFVAFISVLTRRNR